MTTTTVSTDRFPDVGEIAYDRVRDDIQSGDLLLCSGSYPFSRILQFATDSCWSHVGLILRLDPVDRVMVLESVETFGVRTIPLSKYLNDFDNAGGAYRGGVIVARHRGFSKAAKALGELTRHAIDEFGQSYGSDHITRIALRILMSKLPRDSGVESLIKELELPELRGGESYICSEYVHECFERAGVSIPRDERGFVAPADFARDAQLDLVAVLKRPPQPTAAEHLPT